MKTTLETSVAFVSFMFSKIEFISFSLVLSVVFFSWMASPHVDLVSRLVKRRVLTDPTIIRAMTRVNRGDFVMPGKLHSKRVKMRTTLETSEVENYTRNERK